MLRENDNTNEEEVLVERNVSGKGGKTLFKRQCSTRHTKQVAGALTNTHPHIHHHLLVCHPPYICELHCPCLNATIKAMNIMFPDISSTKTTMYRTFLSWMPKKSGRG